MAEIELTPHVEEIKRVLENKVDEEVIVNELNKYLNEYHVTLDSAKRGIIRKYGGGDVAAFTPAGAVVKKIDELTGTEQNVDIQAKVIYVENKSITVKGLSKTIVSGILGDETGTASFTIWEPGSVMLEKGSVYNFKNCYCKLWNDKVQINLGNRGRVEPASGVSIDLPERTIAVNSSECKIGDIRDGMGSVTVTGRIVTYEARNVMVKGEPKTVYSGIIADDTGKIQYSAWNDFSLKEGETICVKNAYIRSWKGIPQLNMGDRCEISRVDSVFDVVDTSGSKKTIDEITRIGGGLDITLEGMVVDMRAGSGLIKRCPQCNRSILNGVCTAHGQVNGTPDLRMKIVLDDGTGAIGAIVNRKDTETLTGITLKAAEGLAMAQGEGVVAREVAGKILMKRISITGNVMSDDYGPSMIVKSASVLDVDVVSEANKLLDEVEGSL
ncbi:MAG: single-stranded DNA-binding protein [Candidatus Methanomethylophilaceae archaeon]|nr:single-stranded DNA-binding protein [Candidatus Methanomethylophilaceae archaeon]